MHVVLTIGYLYYNVFDLYTFFMPSNFQSWAASKGIKLEPSTIYYAQTDSQLEIKNKEIIQVVRGCKAERNEWLSKILDFQLKLNSNSNVSRRNNPFVIVLDFHNRLGLLTFPYLINKYQPGLELCNSIS